MRSISLALLLLLPLAVVAAELDGRVVKVVDGDTVYVLDADRQQHKIRLAGIDAPERGQPFGTKSKERLAEMVAGKDVEVRWYKKDRWGTAARHRLGRLARRIFQRGICLSRCFCPIFFVQRQIL